MSDAILSKYCSATIVYWWKGSTSIAILPTSVSNVVGQHDNIENITFIVIFFFYVCNLFMTGENAQLIVVTVKTIVLVWLG